MSVINDMLRDLDARKAPEREQPAQVAVAEIIEPQTQPPYLLKWGLLLGLVFLVGIGAALFLLTGQSMTSDVATITESEVTAVAGLPDTHLESVEVSPDAELPAPQQAPDAVLPTTPVSNERAVSDAESPRAIASAAGTAPQAEATDTPSTSPGALNDQPTPAPTDQRVQTTTSAPSVAQQASAVTNNEVTSIPAVRVAQPPQQAETPHSARSLAVAPPTGVTLSPSERDHSVAREAQKLIAQGQSNEAYRLLYEFLASTQQDEKSRAVLAGHLMQEGRYAEAGDLLLDASVIDNPDLRQIKARWYMQQGDSDLALYTLREMQPEVHEYPGYYALLASYYQQLGYPRQAASVYEGLLEYDPEAADWWAGLAIARDQEKRFDEARVAYTRALELPGLNRKLAAFAQQRIEVLEP